MRRPALQGAAAFLQTHWERKPAVIRASAARKAFFNGLFSWAELQRLAAICDEEGEPLEFGVDVNAARYVGGRRETPNGEVRPPSVRHCSNAYFLAGAGLQQQTGGARSLLHVWAVTAPAPLNTLVSRPPRRLWHRLRMLKP